jgi:hypothetical protein
VTSAGAIAGYALGSVEHFYLGEQGVPLGHSVLESVVYLAVGVLDRSRRETTTHTSRQSLELIAALKAVYVHGTTLMDVIPREWPSMNG